MTEADVAELALIALVAVLAPLLAETTRRIGIPGVVMEIGLGIVIGPGVLQLAGSSAIVVSFSTIGLTLLMFLAGYELELSRVVGRPLRLAAVGWLCSLVIAAVVALTLRASGFPRGDLLIALALTTTALGTLVPALRDSGIFATLFGRHMLAVGSVGEFGPIILVALLFSSSGDLETVVILVVFAVLLVGTALLARRTWGERVNRLLIRGLRASSQLPIRMTVLLLVGLVLLAGHLGVDVLIGAFAAGVIVRLAIGSAAHTPDGAVFEGKLEAIGFGFFVPVFFIVSGIEFDIQAFIDSPSTLLRIPLFFGLLLVVRGLPVLFLYRHDLADLRQRLALAVLSSTGLPLIVVITTLGLGGGYLGADDAAALVGAGMLSVIVLPALGQLILRPVTAALPARSDRSESGGSSEAL